MMTVRVINRHIISIIIIIITIPSFLLPLISLLSHSMFHSEDISYRVNPAYYVILRNVHAMLKHLNAV